MPRARSLFALASVLLMVQGCASKQHSATASAAPAPSASPAPVPSGPTKVYTMRSGGRDVLRLAAPSDAPCTLGEGSFDVRSRDGYVNVWLVRDATTVEQGAQRAGSQIISEFKDFKPTSTTPITLPATGGAGDDTRALRILGAGLEADDNDPGTADVIVFQKSGRVFIACTHGETMRSSAQALMLTLVQTATAP